MDSRRWLCLALAVTALLVPEAAQAATVRCVPALVAGCGASYASINAAVTAAANDDTIKIAAGTYAEAVNTTKRLNFVGAGSGTLASSAGATVVAPASNTAFTLPNGGSLRSLRAVGATGFTGSPAIQFAPSGAGVWDYSVTDVIGIGGTGTDITFGFGGAGLTAQSSAPTRVINLSLSGGAFQGGSGNLIQGAGLQVYANGGGVTASLANTTARGPAGGSFGGYGLLASGGVTLDATGLTAAGFYAVYLTDSSVTLRRSAIDGLYNGVLVNDGTAATPTAVTIADSLVTATPTSAVNAAGVAAATSSSGTPVTVNLRGSTVFARGVDPQYAVVARPNSGAPMATINLQNTIARLEGTAESGEADVAADRGTVTATNSDFATSLALNAGTVPAPGSAANLTADPLFAPGGFTLQASSPLIDHGSSAFVTAGELDLAGNPRSAGAAPDIGAFEYQPPAPPPPPPPTNERPQLGKVTMTNSVFAPIAAGAASPHRARKQVKRGTRFRYRLSEAATVSIAIERRARGVRSRGSKRCVALTRKRARGKRKGKPCRRWLRAGTLRALQQSGAQSMPFSGRLKGRALRPGSYRARVKAKDGGGARSRERRVSFKIVRAR